MFSPLVSPSAGNKSRRKCQAGNQRPHRPVAGGVVHGEPSSFSLACGCFFLGGAGFLGFLGFFILWIFRLAISDNDSDNDNS